MLHLHLIVSLVSIYSGKWLLPLAPLNVQSTLHAYSVRETLFFSRAFRTFDRRRCELISINETAKLRNDEGNAAK